MMNTSTPTTDAHFEIPSIHTLACLIGITKKLREQDQWSDPKGTYHITGGVEARADRFNERTILYAKTAYSDGRASLLIATVWPTGRYKIESGDEAAVELLAVNLAEVAA